MILDIYLRVFVSKVLKIWPDLSLLLIGKYERRDVLNRELVSKRELELEVLENCQLIQIVCSGKRDKGMAEQEFSQEKASESWV